MRRQKKHHIFDLDDTLMPNSWKYNNPALECALIMSRVLGPDCPYFVELMDRRGKLDRELIKTMHFSTKRFPTSWVEMYREICTDLGRQPDPRIEGQLWDTAATFQRGPFDVYPGVPQVLNQLLNQGDELYLVTSGEEDLQQTKIGQSGLRSFFRANSIFVVQEDKRPAMAEIIGGNDPREYVVIGDSLSSEITHGKALGAWTIWRRGSTWAYANSTHVDPDFIVDSISEVPQRIEIIAQRI